MPAWWSKKPLSATKTPLEQHLADRLAIADASWKSKGKAKSFDDVFGRRPRNGPSSSPSFPTSGFDSDGGVSKRGHPLPRPSDLTAVSSLPLLDRTTQGSASVSSVGSSGSSDGTPDLGCRYAETVRTSRARSEKADSSSQQQHLTENLQFHTSYSSHPRQDLSTSPRGELLSNGYVSRGETSETKCSSRTRSPGPTSTSHSPLSSSPLHPRLSGFHLNSSSDEQEDVKIPCHPLPLPPSSPTSPSHAFRSSGSNEDGQSLRSKWKMGKLLGRGTFGHVYLGFNSENGNMCAIKEVRVISDDQNSRESLKQLNQEIALLSQLSHPNIVQYYGSELAEESLSVYLEYVSGGSIHKLLQEYGPFREPVIRSYARQILSGLAYLHERNTVHRDIKGANILVDPNGEIKLADFGMAKHINSCTNVLSFKGSPYWMAPEVIMNANGYNLAVDIWSLGCTILEMATSKAPWSQYEGVAAIFKIGNSKDIPDIPQHISDDGKNFLNLCLQRDPSDRPTAAQLIEHPFVRDYSATRVARTTVSKHLQPSGDRSIFLHREISRSQEPDSDIKHKAAYPTGLNQSRENVHPRVNLSLPVSPCSSPLRQFGAGASGNYFLSLPHPTATGFGFDTHPIYPLKGTICQARRSIETSSDIHLFKQQTPGGSPRAID